VTPKGYMAYLPALATPTPRGVCRVQCDGDVGCPCHSLSLCACTCIVSCRARSCPAGVHGRPSIARLVMCAVNVIVLWAVRRMPVLWLT
jgi:hypothetical protein